VHEKGNLALYQRSGKYSSKSVRNLYYGSQGKDSPSGDGGGENSASPLGKGDISPAVVLLYRKKRATISSGGREGNFPAEKEKKKGEGRS